MPEVTARDAINFAAGPAQLPLSVLERARNEFLNFQNTHCNVMELSHRSKSFLGIITKAEQNLRTVLSIPDNYKVLFVQGGGNGQFSAVPQNLINFKPKNSADYIVTGYWSEKAAQEAQKYGKVNLVVPKRTSYVDIPDHSEWKLDGEASYVYYCDNETIDGVEFDQVPFTGDVPIVADCSSNFLSKPIDVKSYGLIFASAQKNMGPAGVTVVIVRDDLIGRQLQICPTIFDYKILADNQSMINTPPTYGIYMCGLTLEWIQNLGGINAITQRNSRKATLLYEIIDDSNGFYSSPVAKSYRSRMNVPFRICKNGKCDEALEQKFLSEAEKNYNLRELKGHRSVGGIRASIYNAISEDEVKILVRFMGEFHKQNA